MSWVDSLDVNDDYIMLVVFEFNGTSDGNSDEELSLLRVSGLMVVPLMGRPAINIYYSILHFKVYIELWLNLLDRIMIKVQAI